MIVPAPSVTKVLPQAVIAEKPRLPWSPCDGCMDPLTGGAS